jgi:hypothetical protein
MCDRLTGCPAARPPVRQAPRRLVVESLEDRTAPASFQGLGGLRGSFTEPTGMPAVGSTVVGAGRSASDPEAFGECVSGSRPRVRFPGR